MRILWILTVLVALSASAGLAEAQTVHHTRSAGLACHGVTNSGAGLNNGGSASYILGEGFVRWYHCELELGLSQLPFSFLHSVTAIVRDMDASNNFTVKICAVRMIGGVVSCGPTVSTAGTASGAQQLTVLPPVVADPNAPDLSVFLQVTVPISSSSQFRGFIVNAI